MHRRPARNAAIAVAVALSGACSAEEPAAAPPPEPVVVAAPTPTAPETVTVSSKVDTLSLADDDVMTKRTGRLAIDADAVAATATAVTDLIQAHVDDLNAGRPGLLAELAAPGLLDVDASLGDLLGTWLADATTFATDVDLSLRVGAHGAPRWVEADVDVLRIDGSHVRLDVVFAVEEGDLQLVLLSLPDEVAS